jgi:DNA-binding SARP family transcriptional activator
MGRCTVSLLGRFEVRVDGNPINSDAWRNRRAADVVKLLALEPRHEMHREVAMDLLWPELDVEAAGSNLRNAVHYARRAMQAEEAIGTKGGLLLLWGGDVEVDVLRFLDAADRALAAGDAEGCGVAADLYAGELLPADRYEAWAADRRERLRDRYVSVLKGARRWGRVLDLDQTDEEAHRALMRGYYETGRRREAIRQFERLRDALREHMGVGPDPDTIELYERILGMEVDEPITPAQRAAVLVATGLVHLNRGEFDEAERLARQTKAMAIDAGLGHELGDAATLLALVSYGTGRWEENFREEFTASLTEQADVGLAMWDANSCFAEYYVSNTEDPARWAGLARDLLNLAVKAGSVPGRSAAQLMLGEALLSAGDLRAALNELEVALELGTRAGALCLRCLALEHLAEVQLALGEADRALDLLEQARPAAEDSALRSHLLVRLLGVGLQIPVELPVALAAMVKAERQLAEASRVCDPCSINYHVQAGAVCARAADLPGARRHLAIAERVAGLWPGDPWSAAVWETRATIRLAEGERSQAAAFFREAASGFARSQRPVAEKRCLAAAAAV